MFSSKYRFVIATVSVLVAALAMPSGSIAQIQIGQLASWKSELAEAIDGRRGFTANIVDQIFSFAELGFQEFETSGYLAELLREHGFTVEEGVAGIPTAWVATWGSGRPKISLGTDIDNIPKASQMPGVACHLPLVEGAPGHGEGHNSGMAVQITAALAVKELMQREGLEGTIQIWPGVAEELVATKAYYVREGMFEDVDIVLYAHVGNNLSTSWGMTPGTGLISAMFTFEGSAAHAGGAPWRGRSAADAVNLMEVGWNFRREHLRTQHRSHSVVYDGGDQPNVVPSKASIWFYFREKNYPQIRDLFVIGDSIAKGAAMMSGTVLDDVRIIGSAWPGHFNQVIAEAMYENIQQVGLPQWTEDDQRFAQATQREVGTFESGLATELSILRPALTEAQRTAGFADDIGDISWNVPTATLSFPSNIPGLPGHHWANAIAMATPIAHKGATQGAMAQAMTLLDFMVRPELVDQAWDYFENIQNREIQYTPFIRPSDQPATEMNAEIMEDFREEMQKYYYDSDRYDSYLDQLGVSYPTLRQPDGRCTIGSVSEQGN
ncbi:MAG: aminobenzoyl-glutamate utilization protein B [Gemmatimonadota bacterium]|nr:MAG: aminobenzoyl-glutamate utilization protein B [Gemmatimonadota bacterium]